MFGWSKQVLKRTPLLGARLADLARHYRVRGLKARSAEEIFTDIYYREYCRRGYESASGTGSDLAQTRQIVAALPLLFADHGVRSILDIPCGDFHWMRSVDLRGISYVGADIVRDLIAQNQQYATGDMTFQRMNLLEDPLPKVDLVFCRDCLVHFSVEDVFKALHNIAASGSRLLLTTTFPGRPRNAAIATGEWQPLNLAEDPFRLPPPVTLIAEGCTEVDGQYADKSLGLWKVSELFRAQRLERNDSGRSARRDEAREHGR
jgi:SAM-dependent methyltransferase